MKKQKKTKSHLRELDAALQDTWYGLINFLECQAQNLKDDEHCCSLFTYLDSGCIREYGVEWETKTMLKLCNLIEYRWFKSVKPTNLSYWPISNY